MLYDEPIKLVGTGLEGIVEQIAPNLVRKTWKLEFYRRSLDDTPEQFLQHVKARFESVKESLEQLPDDLREFCAVPEFVGYEIIDAHVVTYHEYINSELFVQDAYYMFSRLSIYYLDVATCNVIYSRGKLYLVDVVPHSYASKFKGEWR